MSSDPVAWGVGVMLACMGLAELATAMGFGAAVRMWAEIRADRKRMGFKS